MKSRPPAARGEERWPLAKLRPSPNNARRHPKDQIETLRRSLREFGWTFPLLIDPAGEIIAGHGRFEAARAEGMADAPVIVARGWTEKQKRAYRLLDNRVAMGAEWDEEMLRAELIALDGVDLVADLGFSPDELAAWEIPGFELEERLRAADETPPLPRTPITRPGDLWQIGPHRLLCGDSTNAKDVARLLNGARPHLMVTDPPYGVDYDANWRNEVDRANGTPYGARAIGSVKNDGEADWTPAWALFVGDVAYCWHAGRHASRVQASLERAGFAMRSQIIWAKDRLIISRGDYHWQHEPCWYAVRKGAKGHWAGDRSQTTLWQIAHRKSETGHSTQKPVECMRRPILNNSKPTDSIYDPFLGSGTTMVAAQMEGRVCLGLEIDPGYCDVIVERMAKFAGLETKRDRASEDRIDAEIAAARLQEIKAAPERLVRGKRLTERRL